MVTLVTSRHISVSPITARTLLRSFPDFVSLFLSYLLFALPSFFFFCLAPCCSFYFVPAERWLEFLIRLRGSFELSRLLFLPSLFPLSFSRLRTISLPSLFWRSAPVSLASHSSVWAKGRQCSRGTRITISLSRACTVLFCFFLSLSLSLLWGSLWSMQDTLLQSAVEKGPNFAPLANELSPCWAAFRPAGCCYCGHRLVHIGWWEEPEQRSESEKRCSAAKAWALLCLPVRTTTAYAGTAAGTSFSFPLPPSILLLSNTTWLASPSLSACPGALTEYFCSCITSRSAVLSSRVFHFFSVLNSHLTLLPKCTGIHGSRITWVTSSSAAKVSAVT